MVYAEAILLGYLGGTGFNARRLRTLADNALVQLPIALFQYPGLAWQRST
jgi:hypothetical protein